MVKHRVSARSLDPRAAPDIHPVGAVQPGKRCGDRRRGWPADEAICDLDHGDGIAMTARGSGDLEPDKTAPDDGDAGPARQHCMERGGVLLRAQDHHAGKVCAGKVATPRNAAGCKDQPIISAALTALEPYLARRAVARDGTATPPHR